MKLLKDITTIFIILFTSIIAFGAIVVLFKAIFVSLSNLFVCIVLVLVVSVVYSYAQGYKIYKDEILVIDKTPISHCYDSLNYDHSNAAFDILNLEGIQIESVDGENEE